MTISKNNKLALTLLMIGLLSSCASNPEKIVDKQIKTYLLDTSSNRAEFNNSVPLVSVQPIVLPAFLDELGLVMLETDHRISVAQYHSWAEPLSNSARRFLLSELNQQSNDLAFVENCDDCASVEVEIDQLYPTAEGQAILTGSYSVSRGGQTSRQVFSMSQALEQNGYEHAVAKMRQLLAQLAQRISSSLN